MDEARRIEAIDRASEGGKYPVGTSRKPKFAEPMRGIWASETNPQRDGLYVETIVRTGKCNRGKFYRLTDGKGKFWQYWASETVFLTEENV